MALTLTTELSTEKDKQGHKPILLFNFKDLSIRVGTRDYTLSGLAYVDFIRFGSVGSISQSIPELLNRISSVSTIAFSQADYRGNLRNAYLSGGTDLTQSGVEVGLKFDTALTNAADNLILFDGFVGSYNEAQDVMKMNLETRHFKNLPQLPQTLISSLSDPQLNDRSLAVPIQYGDFSTAIDFTFFGDFATLGNGLAICPYYRSDPSTSPGLDGDKLIFKISDHLMNQVPADNFGVSNVPNAFYFFRRKGRWININADNTTTTNAAGGSDFTINRLNGDTPQDHSATLPLWGGAGYSGGIGNLTGNIDLALDGLSSTAAFADTSFPAVVKVHNFNISGLTNSDQKSNQGDAYFYLTARTADGTATIRKKSDDAIHGTQVIINSGTALNQWVKIPLTSPDSILLEDLNDFYLIIESTTAGRIEVAGLVFAIDLQPYDPGNDEQFIYSQCIGREFETDFDGRYTIGNAIIRPSAFIESLFRDEFAFTSINTASFDQFAVSTSTEEIAVTIMRQQSADSILTNISQALNAGIVISPNGEALIVNSDPAQSFTDSGTDTAGNEDIYTDSANITSGSFDEHPILRGTFRKSRSDPRNITKRRAMNYGKLAIGDYLYTQFDGTGDVINTTNDYVSDQTTAELVNARTLNWINNQKWIIEFRTYYNAIANQLGDVRNVRHGDLADIILPGTVNNQKWVLIGYSFNWDGTMNLKFIQL